MAITRRQRLRRTAIVCLHCLRNLAFFRAADNPAPAWLQQQFWVTARNNFLDTAVLEWCKVFGDSRAKQDWRKSVTDQMTFLARLLAHIQLTEDAFTAYITEMRTYRDKFLAHLDEENRMNIPRLETAIGSAEFLYEHLLNIEDDCNAFNDNAPQSAAAYYERYLAEGQAIYPVR